MENRSGSDSDGEPKVVTDNSERSGGSSTSSSPKRCRRYASQRRRRRPSRLTQISKRVFCNLARYRLVFLAFGWQFFVYMFVSAALAPTKAVLCDTGATCNPLQDWCGGLTDGQYFTIPISTTAKIITRRKFAAGSCYMSSSEARRTAATAYDGYRNWAATVCAYWNATSPAEAHSHLAHVPNRWMHDVIHSAVRPNGLACHYVGLMHDGKSAASNAKWYHEGYATNQYFTQLWDVTARYPPHDDLYWSTYVWFRPEPDNKDNSACMWGQGQGLVGRPKTDQRDWMCQYEYKHEAPWVFRRLARDHRPVDEATFQTLPVARGIGARHACHIKCGTDRLCKGYASSATAGMCRLAYDVLSDDALEAAAGYITYEKLHR